MTEPKKGLNEAGEQLPNGDAQVDSGTESTADKEAGAEQVDKVSLDTHRRTLASLKNTQLRLKELEQRAAEWESKQRDAEEKVLQEKGEWSKLVELKTKQLMEMQAKLAEREAQENALKRTLFDAAKLQAVRERLPGQLIRSEYAQFIDIDKVIMNPETNEIDEDSVAVVADEFVRAHSGLLKRDSRQLPNGSPSASAKLTYEQWLKLPAKEKPKRMKDVEGFKGQN